MEGKAGEEFSPSLFSGRISVAGSKARATSISSFRRLEQRIPLRGALFTAYSRKMRNATLATVLTCASSEISVKPLLPRPPPLHGPRSLHDQPFPPPLFSRRAKIIRAATSATRNPEKSVSRRKIMYSYDTLAVGNSGGTRRRRPWRAGWQYYSRASC